MFITDSSHLSYIPKRIVSLVPSQTELLSYLNLENSTVGITKFCVHPAQWHLQKTIIGGTKNIDFKKINALQPDLIIANKEENVKGQIDMLAEHFPVWLTDVNNLQEALKMIADIGVLTNKKISATALISNIQQAFTRFKPCTNIAAAYLIWQDPYMTIGGDTFINNMLKLCGLHNVFAHLNRYPIITLDMLKEQGCELLLLSSEPFPFKQKHLDNLQLQLPDIKILLVNGEMFSWYGSRLNYAVEYFESLIKTIKP